MDIARQALAIALVFSLLGTALWLLRRKGMTGLIYSQPGGRNPLAACGKLALGPQHSLHLVRIGNRTLVLGVYPAGITLLCDFDGPAATPGPLSEP